ncbi:universal stress protein [Halorubrum vacuolatum]|uniref:Nucleotide-binding universal stress protein, UspA family n=1 Tax=Halorubrum vacuolatum TaxID=63740 RepID=A0A238XMT6_HALVU|nr:universal stress protein [Halorubrum vacuolatum]SNR59289.1 Nucleotide-binding universal stress protein, UspA family [Halorubrum vacuolatum]
MSQTATQRRTESTGIETVLIAVDTEDENRTAQLTEEAIDVAAPVDAAVTLLHVFTEDEFDEVREVLAVDAASEESSPDAVAKRHTTTRTVSKALSAADVDHEIRGAVGDHADGIVAVAEDIEADRILVGGRNRSPTGKAVFGSVAQDVMLTAPCPVTFVRSDTE